MAPDATQVVFGEVRQSSRSSELLSALKPLPASRPVLLTVCNGDLESKEVYTGAMKSEALQKALEAYAGGRKCAEALRLDEQTDLSTWTAASLKKVCRDKAIPCRVSVLGWYRAAAV